MSGKIFVRLLLSVFFLLGAALIAVSLFYEQLLPQKEASPAELAVPSSPIRPAPPRISPRPEITRLPIAKDAAISLGSTDATAEDDLSTLEVLLSEYARHHQGNPVGENVEITASLLGKNPSGAAYLEDHGPFLDSSKQLIDRWGTPYVFHQISAKQTEIRSAGPDRGLYTSDDLVR